MKPAGGGKTLEASSRPDHRLHILGETEPGLPGWVIAQTRRVFGNAFTAIQSINYDPATRTLSVWFVPSGNRYDYDDVPPQTYAAFRKASSKGRFFNAFIRDRYSYHLVAQSQSG
ncbi:KTSC domain-containing protein [Mesorhizobium sp. AA22]|uniref:KTSC domain-containing protein n=1 Tax=Mesorhizobium sp. AA22 TaxID=1854057 RepID=UPI000B0E1597